MRVKEIKDEDFVNYKVPSMFVATCFCDFKCCRDANIPISTCQNEPIAKQLDIEISADEILRRYQKNPITYAIVIGGLEPMLQFDEVLELVRTFRNGGCQDPIIIYTGYYESEIVNEIGLLSQFPNIILKVGRFKPGQKPHKDELLGVMLVNDEQKAIQIS